ncbi:unnamed protein product [Bursaphelenchus xylophilus]|uniref:(pine wood nematode) hypothetical protein n=1 Tax=Bursaphelenchus xylophilus TaxID=6326 RepID=A0A1I7SQJ4_BURXY|nr:unnamed protein product [Bursaphelenchus xylophilus]CAG9109990.1 unnamed protein product [Bursaphelenchus xylophilus]
MVKQNEELYEIEKILEHSVEPEGVLYRIKWKGYSLKESTWEPERSLTSCPKILAAYKKKNKLDGERTIKKTRRPKRKPVTQNEPKEPIDENAPKPFKERCKAVMANLSALNQEMLRDLLGDQADYLLEQGPVENFESENSSDSTETYENRTSSSVDGHDRFFPLPVTASGSSAHCKTHSQKLTANAFDDCYAGGEPAGYGKAALTESALTSGAGEEVNSEQ